MKIPFLPVRRFQTWVTCIACRKSLKKVDTSETYFTPMRPTLQPQGSSSAHDLHVERRKLPLLGDLFLRPMGKMEDLCPMSHHYACDFSRKDWIQVQYICLSVRTHRNYGQRVFEHGQFIYLSKNTTSLFVMTAVTWCMPVFLFCSGKSTMCWTDDNKDF